MATKRKIKKVKLKIRVKWKNVIILLIGTTLIIVLLVKWIGWITNSLKEDNKKTPEIKETKKPNVKPKEKVLTEEEKKLNKLDNVNKRIDFFNLNYLDRYIEYKEKNTDLDIIQIIKNVNMHLDKQVYEDIEPAKYLNTTNILVNKHYYLDENYEPDNLETIDRKYALSGMKLVKEAKEAFEKMASDAKKEKLNIVAMSTYRSYNYQVDLYNRYVRQDGKEAADTYSGRPGHSEHQTGLAVDVYDNEIDYTKFEKTNEFKWMDEHAHEYGFILRFPKDKEKETGYIYESWHYRYVGIEAAKYIKENNISFEEYYATKIKGWN